jgi:hypothetical protein
MSDEKINHAALHLTERESVQLARAVQILVQELGFDPEEVDRSYKESLAFFLKDDHLDQGCMSESHVAVQTGATA